MNKSYLSFQMYKYKYKVCFKLNVLKYVMSCGKMHH